MTDAQSNDGDEQLSADARLLIDRVRQTLARDLAPTDRDRHAILGRVLSEEQEESLSHALSEGESERSGTSSS